MNLIRFKVVTLTLLSLGVVGTGAAVLMRQPIPVHSSSTDTKSEPASRGQPVEETTAGLKEKGRTDAFGDLLPAGARLRLGTTRLQHEGEVRQIAFTPDGKAVASLSDDAMLILWEMPTGKEIRRIALGKGDRRHRAFTFSRNDKTLATIIDNTLCLVELATGKVLFRFGPALCWAFSPDGKTLTALEADRRPGLCLVTVWDLAQGRRLRQGMVGKFSSPVERCAFSPDGQILAIVDDDDDGPLIRLWEVATGNDLRQWKVPKPYCHNLAFSPDGKLIATGTGRLTIRLWEVATGKEVSCWRAYGKEEEEDPLTSISWLAFSADGKSLFYPAPPLAVHQWDWAAGREVRRFERVDGPAAVSLDGKTLAVAGLRHEIRLLELATGTDLRPLPRLDSGGQVVFSPDGKSFAWAPDRTIRLCEAATGKEIRQFRGHGDPVRYLALFPPVAVLAFSPDGAKLASGGTDNTVRLWDVATGQQLHQLTQEGFGALHFTPDGKRLCCLSDRSADKQIRVWDVATGQQLHRWEASDAALPADAQVVALANREDKTIRIRQTATGTEVWQLRGYQPLVRYLLTHPRAPSPGNATSLSPHFSPDGKILAAGGEAREEEVNALHLWEVTTGKPLLYQLSGQEFALSQLSFSPDSRSLALMGSDGVICLVDVATGKVARRMDDGGWDELRSGPAFSPDGRLLATTRSDGVIRLWEVLTGRELWCWQGHRARIGGLVFSSDGRSLTSVSWDRTALVWDVTDPLPDRGPPAEGLTAERFEALWADLGGDDARRGRRVIEDLITTGDQAVSFLRQRLQPAPAADPKRVARLITELDSNEFEVREKAEQELKQLGDLAGPTLRQARTGQLPPEARRRIDELLDWLVTRPLPPAALRVLRAIEVLERVGSREAKQVLEKLAQGAPAARITEESQVALARLAKQSRK